MKNTDDFKDLANFNRSDCTLLSAHYILPPIPPVLLLFVLSLATTVMTVPFPSSRLKSGISTVNTQTYVPESSLVIRAKVRSQQLSPPVAGKCLALFRRVLFFSQVTFIPSNVTFQQQLMLAASPSMTETLEVWFTEPVPIKIKRVLVWHFITRP